MGDTLRGGLIGAGYFAANHFHAWREIDGVEIVAVCDLDVKKAQEAARQYEIEQIYADAAQMMREAELDFVDIVTTVSSHRALVELAAEHRLHTICQKPFALSMDDGRAMVHACKEAGVKLMVHENFRWQTPMQMTYRHLDIGKVFYGTIEFRSAFDVYANQPYLAEDERFIIYDVGIHLFDLARFFMGEVEQLTAHTQQINPDINGEDVATILLQMKDGHTCLVTASYSSQWEIESFPETLVHLEGSEGTVHLGRSYELKVIKNGATMEERVEPRMFDWSNPPGHNVQDSVVAIQQHWVECLRNDTEPHTSGEDNLKTLELVFGAYQSAETGLPYRVGTL